MAMGLPNRGFISWTFPFLFPCLAVICQICTPFSQKATEGILAQYICQLLLCALQASRFSIFLGSFSWYLLFLPPLLRARKFPALSSTESDHKVHQITGDLPTTEIYAWRRRRQLFQGFLFPKK